METFKALVRRHWPALRLRTILFGVLLVVAAMPVASAVFLRVYENTLVRQTEAELIAQGAALVAAAEASWPGAVPAGAADRDQPGYYRPESTTIDLSAGQVLPERPRAAAPLLAADPDALAVARTQEPVFEGASRTTLASIVLLDRLGRVVRGAEAGGSYAALPEVAAALDGRPRTVMRSNRSVRPRYSLEWLSRASALRLHHARPIRANGQVVGVLLLSRSPRALFRGLYEDRGKILLGVGGVLTALTVLAGLVSRGVTRPIEALSAASRQVASGQGDVPRTPATAAVEIQALYEDFRAMAEAIDRRSRYLKDFAAAVSHEFKTPLAGIQGAVELLQDHHAGMSEDERRCFLANIASDSARLSQLVTRLLDLARADMAAPEADAASDLAAPLRRLADAHAGPGFVVHIDLPVLSPVALPQPALEAVLETLIDNARKAGASRIAFTARSGPSAVVLTAADDGPGVAEADRDRLFEPFFTTRRASGGTGLGLSIAQSLLNASGARIDLRPSAAGARFDLTFPRAAC